MSSYEKPAEYLTVLDSRTGRDYTIPITNNSVKAVDLGSITPPTNSCPSTDAGLKVFDRGFVNTACVESSITFINGRKGHIQYRDFSIHDLFQKHEYEDVVHLLVWGHLPSAEEKATFRRALAAEMTKIPKSVMDTIRALPSDSSTSSMIFAGLGAYTATDEGSQASHRDRTSYYLGNMSAVDSAIIRTMSAVATTVALVYCHKHGREFTPADPDGSFIGNTLLMMGRVGDDGKPNAKLHRSLEGLWILYADHGMTNSTAAMLHAASTLTDPISACMAGIISAYGPLHGGAISLAYKEFKQIGSVDRVPALIAAVKTKKQRLFGFGHRIYKTIDPRTRYIRRMIDEYLDESDMPFLKVALEIDRIASTDEYFTSRNLKANADLYGALLYTAMGFEADIIVAMAVLSRVGGGMAYWREAMNQSPVLWRPQQLFNGSVYSDDSKSG
ncbi:hypothetical protein G6O67_003548 [Ophiocordyceps sinensis]|uniref:Citrate synthase n=1 Tax=Ophiocordyceps sinensis TaxID=72228 RepID=A0A8H4PS05_9HYPO|nr:hypothetical protein G6O67_003548 [Ophiocordyceps sinensis]